MKTINLKISKVTFETLEKLAKDCTNSDTYFGANTNGPLNIVSLLTMLAEDAALVITRPGCWEASNMTQVLTSHGYKFQFSKTNKITKNNFIYGITEDENTPLNGNPMIYKEVNGKRFILLSPSPTDNFPFSDLSKNEDFKNMKYFSNHQDA